MTITIKKIIDNERGSVSIEATFITLFFVAVLSFSMYQALQYTQHLKAYKIATQLAEIISQRNVFFSGRDLSGSDVTMLEDVLEDFIPKFSHQKISILIEEQAYATRAYQSIEISPVKSYCKIKKRLNEYDIDAITSYGKSNSIYRVTVCLKNQSDFFSDTPDIIAGVAVQIGHHH